MKHSILVKEFRLKKEGKPFVDFAIDLALEQGQITLLMGPSGAGKTKSLDALLNNISSDFYLESGYVEMNGQKMHIVSRQWRAFANANIAYLPQDYSSCFNPFVCLKSHAKLAGDPIRVKNTLSDLGFESHLIKKIFESNEKIFPRFISGGQQQLFLLALFLCHLCRSDTPQTPKFMLLDEPTASIDEESKNKLFEALNHLRFTYKVGLLITSHDLALSEAKTWRDTEPSIYWLSRFQAANPMDEAQPNSLSQSKDALKICHSLRSIAEHESASPSSTMRITIENLKVPFESHELRYFNPVSNSGFTFPETTSRIIGIQGKSGSGKSTLARLLLFIIKQRGITGRITYFAANDHDSPPILLNYAKFQLQDSRNKKTVAESTFRQIVTGMPQDCYLSFYPNERLMDSWEALQSVRSELDADFMQKEIDDLLISKSKNYEISKWFSHRKISCATIFKHLSGGERKIAAIVTALALKPEAIILDEPSAGLDFDIACRLTERIKVFAESSLCLVISHDRGFLEMLGAEIWLIDGKTIQKADLSPRLIKL
jgi:ABC-type glutathione transport system ATPase component